MSFKYHIDVAKGKYLKITLKKRNNNICIFSKVDESLTQACKVDRAVSNVFI